MIRIISSVDPDSQFLDVDATISLDAVDAKTVTRFPIEAGFNLSDHTFKQNKQIRMVGVISEATLRANQSSVQIDTSKVFTEESEVTVAQVLGNTLVARFPNNLFAKSILTQSIIGASDVTHDEVTPRSNISVARAFLQDIFNTDTLVKVDTPTEDFDNLIITKLSFTKKKPEKGVLNFSMSLEQIRTVSNTTGILLADIRQEDRKTAAGEVIQGTSEAAKKVTDTEEVGALQAAVCSVLGPLCTSTTTTTTTS